jgi:hypothetical protein
MLIDLAVVHVGQMLGRRAKTDVGKFRTTAIFFVIGMLIILASIPWPGMAYGRGLFPVLIG